MAGFGDFEGSVEVALVGGFEVVGALAGVEEVGGEGGVVGDATKGDAAAGEHVVGGFSVVEEFGLGGLEVVGECFVVFGVEVGEVADDGVVVLVDDGEGFGVACCGGAAAGDVDGHGFGWVLFEPLCDAYGVDGGGGLWWCCGGVHGSAAGFEDFGAEGGAEFEVVEVFGEGFGVDGLEFEFWGCVGEVKVFDHFGELPVEFYLVDAFPEVGADDAFDGVGVVEEVGEVSVLDDPFGGGFFAYFWYGGEVVGWVAAEGGEVWVLFWCESVFVLYRLGGEAVDDGYAFHWVEDGGRVVDELEGVAVAGDDEGFEP